MRVAVVAIPAKREKKLSSIASALARGFETAGHRVEVLDPAGAVHRLAGYDYIAIGTESIGFSGSVPARLAEILAQARGLAGRRSMAFVATSGLRSARTLSRLMTAMEAEGMYVNYAELLASPEAALVAAASAPVERN